MKDSALSGLDDLSGLNSESELPHLSKTIVYETDIAPHPFIGIYAGIGSGKTTSSMPLHVATQTRMRMGTCNNAFRDKPFF